MLQYRGNPVRDLFDTSDGIYFRSGNVCRCAQPVADAVSEFVETWRHGDASWQVYEAAFDTAISSFEQMVNAPKRTVCTIENTSMGISMAANMIAPSPGSNIVVDELTHPSNIFPWKIRDGVELRYAKAIDGKVPIAEYAKLVDKNTAAIDVCHVTMALGFRNDLKALANLAHNHSAYLVVDAAQSAGLVPIDVQDCSVDFLACPTFKWLHGPLGAGFLYVKEGLVTLGAPTMIGWMSARNPQKFDIHEMELYDDARRLQRGVNNGVGLVAAAEGLKLLLNVGGDAIWRHVQKLSGRLSRGLAESGLQVLSSMEDESRAGIVTVAVDDMRSVMVDLYKAGIHAGPYIPGQLRLDVVFYHSVEDIEQTLHTFKVQRKKGIK